ncbi:NAD(P)/FAD-dependent oxidoreductase [Catenovulum maritimum]|nr:FAD-dependent oxidoreductase [Catenovulum maritimum]
MKNIAIIGSGISGLTAAYLLSQKHKVTVFEKNDYIGGHTATKDISLDGKNYAIDTGFIVYNDKTYPNFIKLLRQLGIPPQPTEMSFSVMNKRNGLEYNGNNLNSLFAQRTNLLNPKFWCLIQQILNFNKKCKALYASDDIPADKTLGDFLAENNFSEYFNQNYILPMGAAIWSTSLVEMKAFQLRFFVQFFYNHGLLNVNDRPQWHVIPGGSKQYIEPLTRNFYQQIKLNAKITKISRETLSTDTSNQNVSSLGAVNIHFENGVVEGFDEVILACHSDEALALLDQPTEAEKSVLGGIHYSPNEVVLHTDINLLPKRKLAWASWNYQLGLSNPESELTRPACVTYNMNILQGIKAPHTFCVTLNQTEQIDPAKILRKFTYHHPVFNQVSMAAQQRRLEICGQNNTHFAGAYWHNGFHEDGVKSAILVAKRFGVEL